MCNRCLQQSWFHKEYDENHEYLKNQMIDILMDEGYRVVNNVSNADYCINLKMSDDFLQIQLDM